MHSDATQWDSVIEPHHKLFRLHLRDVFRYRDLLGLLVKRDFISFYKQTILGPLWFFIQPIFTMIVFTFVFGNLAGLSTDGIPKPLFYLTGITLWNYFADSLTKTSTVFRDNAGIFGKVYFPRLIMPLSIVVSNLVKFSVQLVLLALVMFYFSFQTATWSPSAYLLLFPLVIILMAAQGLGFGMIISALTTKYRDLAFLVTFGMQLGMYATPVIYPFSSIPERWQWVVMLNPMTQVIELSRLGLFGQGYFSWVSLAICCSITAVILVSGILIFNKVEKNFVDTV